MFEDKKWDKTFKNRLSKHYDELKWLYSELYHNDQQAFDYFCDMMYEYYEKRSPMLREWDEAREASPDWYKGNDMLGMLMYTNCFAGNLKGVKSHLDYIQECGVNYLHLMPLLESPKDRSDGGYAVSNFRKVQPELGTMEDLAELADDCHTRGMCVCLDFVMNHTSEDHEWAMRAKAGEKEYQDRFFFYDDWTIPNEFEKTVPQVFPQTAPGNFSWCPEVNKVVMTTFWPYQWDLNYANPVVFHLERDRHALPQSAPGAHSCPPDAHGYRGRLPRNAAARRSCYGTEQGRSLFWHHRETRVPHALQRDHYGKHMAHRGDPRRAPAPPPDGSGFRAAS